MTDNKSLNRAGRPKGAVNKTTLISKEVIANLLQNYSNGTLHDAAGVPSCVQMSTDFLSLEAYQRIQIAERLMQYVIPKQQAVTADLKGEATLSIEERLAHLAHIE